MEYGYGDKHAVWQTVTLRVAFMPAVLVGC
jgi:hypothetical protein